MEKKPKRKKTIWRRGHCLPVNGLAQVLLLLLLLAKVINRIGHHERM